MARGIHFPETNATLGPPPGMTEGEVYPLAVCRLDPEDRMPEVVSCWQLSAEELEEIQRTGVVWLAIVGRTMPPALVTGHKRELFGG